MNCDNLTIAEELFHVTSVSPVIQDDIQTLPVLVQSRSKMLRLGDLMLRMQMVSERFGVTSVPCPTFYNHEDPKSRSGEVTGFI